MRFVARMCLAGSLLTSAAVFCANPASKNPWSGTSSSSQRDANSSDANSPPENCLSISDAQKHVGKTHCVTGTVIRVEESNHSVTFLDFCTEYRSCPFTVVVFPGDLKKVGDVRQLQGRLITIKGRIEEYADRAEIILRHPQQLGDSAVLLTAIPKDYDVEREGHYSAGSFRAAKTKKPRHTRQGQPISIEDPEEP